MDYWENIKASSFKNVLSYCTERHEAEVLNYFQMLKSLMHCHTSLPNILLSCSEECAQRQCCAFPGTCMQREDTAGL